MGMGFQMYAQDHDDRFPPSASTYTASGFWGDICWIGIVQPYVSNKSIFLCPGSNKTNPDWTQSTDAISCYGTYPSAGCMNASYLNVTSFVGTAAMEGILGFHGMYAAGYCTYLSQGHAMGAVRRPAEQILVLDHVWFDAGFSGSNFWYPAPRHMAEQDASGTEHGYCNCVFVDGHSKALKHDSVWDVQPMDTEWGSMNVYIHWWPYN
jgi:prepilin-type processing-associated H-X9-DG protein